MLNRGNISTILVTSGCIAALFWIALITIIITLNGSDNDAFRSYRRFHKEPFATDISYIRQLLEIRDDFDHRRRLDISRHKNRTLTSYVKTKLDWTTFNYSPATIIWWPMKACEYKRMESLGAYKDEMLRFLNDLDRGYLHDFDDASRLKYLSYFHMDDGGLRTVGTCQTLLSFTLKVTKWFP